MAKDFENPDQTTGYWDDNSHVTVFNPVTGELETKPVDPDNILEYNPSGDKTIWGDVDGVRTLISTEDPTWDDYGAKKNNDGYYDWTYGYEAPVYETKPDPDGLTLGGRGPDGGTAGGGGGGGGGTTPPITNEPLDPVINEPTDDWFWTDPVGYENAPQPDGDGSFVEGGPPADTSWDWNYFRDKAPGDRQWGGYDEDYQAFERYQPGMDSPWGMPNIAGGNEDFYQQQFVNQLRDEQGFRNRQRQADANRQQVAHEQATGTGYYKPIEADEMWSWTDLPEVQQGGGARTNTWDLNQRFSSGQTTNAEILRWASENLGSSGDQKWYAQHLNNPDYTGGDSTSWAGAGDPNRLISNLPTNKKDLTLNNQRRMTELFNSLYNPGQAGPYAPTGYASPVNQVYAGEG